MNVPYTEEDETRLYCLIGKGVWYLQHLENTVAAFTSLKILQHKRVTGQKVSLEVAELVRTKQQKQTLGPLIANAKSHGTIPAALARRFEKLLAERNWLIHQCVTREYLALRNTTDRERLFARLTAFSDEAVGLKDQIYSLLEQWFVDHGYDLARAHAIAREELRQAERA